jgi:NAD(P)-dependent dehydrogenase (short-subunit alcohol dehydrogenase family)
MSVSFDLSGQRVLVVGASSGLGREIARQADAAGARVAYAARRRDRLDAAVAAARGKAIAVRCDVTREADCERAVAETLAAFGGLDALVYASGVSPLAMLDEAGTDDWNRTLQTNLVGAALVARAAIPALRASRGRALFLSSYAVRHCMAGMALYRVSKLALDGLIECLRDEHRDVDFTRVVVGNTAGTEFGVSWAPENTARIMAVWRERNVFPVNTTMPLEVCAEAVVSVLGVRGYVDDFAVMSRTSDPTLEQTAADNLERARR